MNKHTPGPWNLELRTKFPYGVMVIGADGAEILCQSAHCHSTKQKSRAENEWGVGFDHHGNFTANDAAALIATQDANARLIAAAPELLEALKDMQMWVCAFAQGQGRNALDEVLKSPRMKNARAAIAKATGAA